MTLSVTDLLSRGYFPKESTPMFSSQAYGKVADGLSAAYSEKTWTAPGEFNMVKPGSLRRRLSIPNPFSQRTIARLCAANWAILEQHMIQSATSLTRPVCSTAGRALAFSTPYDRRSYENLRRLGRARYTVVADISDYYGSIYTHSIEWALHTKATAKASLRSGSTRRNPSLGAKLDEAVRTAQEGQTKGIAISPDTSLIISELVLCALDVEIEALLPGISSRCIRFMDDLLFAARSRAEAEDFVHAWETVLGRYHLALNPRKTEIVDGPPPPEAPWHVDLLQFRIRRTSERATTNDIYSLASKAFTLAREYPDESILSYAVRKIDPRHLKPQSWKIFEDFLYASAVAEPASIDKVVRTLAVGMASGHSIDRARAAEVFNEICDHHAPLERGFQVSWAITFLLVLNEPLTSSAALKISKMQDNSSLLLLFNCISLGRIDGGPPDMTSAITRAEDVSATTSEDWLLGYECARNSWTSAQNFRNEAHWDELLQLDIAFFDPLTPPAAQTSMPTPPSGDPVQPSGQEGPQDDADETAGSEALDALSSDAEAGSDLRYP